MPSDKPRCWKATTPFSGGKRRSVNPDRPAAIKSIIRPAISDTRRPNQIRPTSLPLKVSHIIPSVAGDAELTDISTQPDLPVVPPMVFHPQLSIFAPQPPHLFMAPISLPLICMLSLNVLY